MRPTVHLGSTKIEENYLEQIELKVGTGRNYAGSRPVVATLDVASARQHPHLDEVEWALERLGGDASAHAADDVRRERLR